MRADLFKIKLQKPYSTDYSACTALHDRASDRRKNKELHFFYKLSEMIQYWRKKKACFSFFASTYMLLATRIGLSWLGYIDKRTD